MIPELHSSKTNQFNARVPIYQGMLELHNTVETISSLIPKESLKYYCFFLSNQTIPLDNNKPLHFYGVKDMDVVIFKRPSIYEFSQEIQNESLLLRAEVTVREAVRDIIRWVKPEIYGNPQNYGLMLIEVDKKQDLERKIWISDNDQLATYKIHPRQKLYIQCRKKGVLNNLELEPRIINVESCPVNLKSIDSPSPSRSKTLFQCALVSIFLLIYNI